MFFELFYLLTLELNKIEGVIIETILLKGCSARFFIRTTALEIFFHALLYVNYCQFSYESVASCKTFHYFFPLSLI